MNRNRSQIAERVSRTLARRHRAERRFRAYGLLAIGMAVLFVGFLFVSIIGNGLSAFQQTYVKLEIYFDPEKIDPESTGDPRIIGSANYQSLIRNGMRELFPDVSGRRDLRSLGQLISTGASFEVRDLVLSDPDLIGERVSLWLLADDEMDAVIKGHIDRDAPEAERRVNDQRLAWIDALADQDRVERRFNRILFTNGDSRDPEMAGILTALKGSAYALLVTLLLAFPIGVAAAVYLEEFAPRNRWTDLIEVNINNLAAVPSIVFGLLGLAVFINFFGLPRSAPLVGGLVLTLMTLPTIIIASRVALQSVPPSIREAALAVGASPTQTLLHHVLPLALPGMLTGTIIGMARALGETAPLLMIGMVAFIVDPPAGLTDPATALPVQIYLWADSPERAFVERTSAATMVLLAFLFVMNALAVILRRRFERRW